MKNKIQISLYFFKKKKKKKKIQKIKITEVK